MNYIILFKTNNIVTIINIRPNPRYPPDSTHSDTPANNTRIDRTFQARTLRHSQVNSRDLRFRERCCGDASKGSLFECSHLHSRMNKLLQFCIDGCSFVHPRFSPKTPARALLGRHPNTTRTPVRQIHTRG